jgi:pimeloyl-ACP methyl ester carboxylesterase
MWHYVEAGAGPPLILLHGIGMSHAAWNAVIPRLRLTRRVIAFDIAGFGATPALPAGTSPTIGHLVDGLAQSLREMGIDAPVDIAGNSLGGAMALEAARRGLARTVVAISPIGLWDRHPARHVAYVFASLRFAATTMPGVLKALLWNPMLRELALAVPMSTGSRRMPVREAFRGVNDLTASAAFEDTFAHTRVVFDGTDRRHDRLPATVTWIEKARWGHVPMWADPAGVTQVILDSTR